MDRATLRALALVSGLGFAIAIPLGLFVAGGLWLDGRFGTAPLFMLVGVLLGLVAAGFSIKELLAFQGSEPRGKSKRQAPGPATSRAEAARRKRNG